MEPNTSDLYDDDGATLQGLVDRLSRLLSRGANPNIRVWKRHGGETHRTPVLKIYIERDNDTGEQIMVLR
jgi:hypothetical protein